MRYRCSFGMLKCIMSLAVAIVKDAMIALCVVDIRDNRGLTVFNGTHFTVEFKMCEDVCVCMCAKEYFNFKCLRRQLVLDRKSDEGQIWYLSNQVV